MKARVGECLARTILEEVAAEHGWDMVSDSREPGIGLVG